MSSLFRIPPVDVVNMLPVLDRKLMELFSELTAEDWNRQTVAKQWKVKDVAAHLLDGNIRVLSMLRDNYYGEKPGGEVLLDFLNRLNADWIKAMKRVSPGMLILLHEITGPLYCRYYQSLDPFEKAGFAVNWAGEDESRNWMHIAREYTEKFLHQQQIREATHKPGLMVRELYYPFMDIFMLALPYTYRDIKTEEGDIITLTITTDIGGSWHIRYSGNKWQLEKAVTAEPTAEVILDPDTAWKLFSKSWRPADIMDKVNILGNHRLGEQALNMVSVMA